MPKITVDQDYLESLVRERQALVLSLEIALKLIEELKEQAKQKKPRKSTH